MIEVIIRVLNSIGEPVTGLSASNIKFRKQPYGTGDEIVGLVVLEIGSQGNYRISGFTAWQKAKLYINGIVQEWWGEQFTGDPSNNFVDFQSAQNIQGDKGFAGDNLFSGTNEFTGSCSHSGDDVFTGTVEFDSSVLYLSGQVVTMLGDTILRNPVASDPNAVPAPGNLICRKFADSSYIPLSSNRIVVDSMLTADVPGKAYGSISAAVNWAYNNGAPSTNNRWEILIIPHHAAQYTEDFYWYDFIDLVGLGWVKIKNTSGKSIFIRSGQMTDRNVKAVNLHFESTDCNLNFKMMIADNCSMVMVEDNYNPVLTFEDSQLRNCHFGFIGSGVFTPAGSNRLINCSGGVNAGWGLSDKVYNYSYIEGDYIQQ